MNKKLLMFALPVLVIGIVTALSYYGIFQMTLNVNQPITLEGETEQSINCDAGETCLGSAIRVSNSGDNEKIVNLITTNNPDIEVGYVGKLSLTQKDITTWVATGVPREITYTIVGDTFEATNIPEGYTLIYYKDNPANANDADRLLTIGEIGIIAGDLPQSDDWNIGELANYCDLSNGYDDYEHCVGAKLWVVPTSDIVGDALNWANMADYYYETDLIYYFANSEGKITVPAGSYIEFYPQYNVDAYATGGEYVLETTLA